MSEWEGGEQVWAGQEWVGQEGAGIVKVKKKQQLILQVREHTQKEGPYAHSLSLGIQGV